MPTINRIRSPIRSMVQGYAFRFRYNERVFLYNLVACELLLDMLGKSRFTGRAEFYDIDDHLTWDYVVALALVFEEGSPTNPDPAWWQAFARQLSDACEAGGKLQLPEPSRERTRVRSMRTNLLAGGAVQFRDGQPVQVLQGNQSTFFVRACTERIGRRRT